MIDLDILVPSKVYQDITSCVLILPSFILIFESKIVSIP